MKIRHFFHLALSFLLISPAFAGDILKCLGEQEKKIHLSKRAGPEYNLNQKLIAEMVQLQDAQLTPKAYSQVCQSKFVKPAQKLLELTLLEGKSIFVLKSSNNPTINSMNQGLLNDYIETSKELFLEYIASIQMLSPTPTCLAEEIKPLSDFFIEIKHLQEEVDLAELLKKKDAKIFKLLKDYPKAFERCQLRNKKNAKSGSTEAPKKS